MEGRESGVRAGHRLASARSAMALGVLALALNIAALVLVASSGESNGQLIRAMALLPTVALGMLVAVRRPGNPLGWIMLADGAQLIELIDLRGHLRYSVHMSGW